MTTQNAIPRKSYRREIIIFAIIAVVGGAVMGMAAMLLPNPLLALGIIIVPFGVWLIFSNPQWGLFFLFFMVYTRLSDVMVNAHGLPSIAKLFVPFMMVVILVRWLRHRETPIKGGVLWVLAVYGLLSLASGLYAADPDRVFSALQIFVKDSFILLIIIALLRRADTLRLVIWTLLISAIFLGTISLFQQFTGTFANDYWGFAVVHYENIVGQTSDFRIGGPQLGPNGFGRYMLLVAPLALDCLWSEEKPLLRILAAWALTVAVLTIFFTFSRSTFLAMVVTFAFLFYRSYRHKLSIKIVLVTAVVALLVIPFVPDRYTERLVSLSNIVGEGSESFEVDVSLRGRVSENLSAWQMFTDHPFLGVGLDNYEYHYQTYSRKLGLDPRREERAPHSLYLEIMSELGIGGFIWLLSLNVVAFRGLWQAEKTFRELGMIDHASICIALSAALVGFLVSGLFIHNSFPRFFWMLYGLLLAVPIVAKSELEAANKVADA